MIIKFATRYRLQTFCLSIGNLTLYTNIVPVPYAEIFKWSCGAFYFYYKRYAWKVAKLVEENQTLYRLKELEHTAFQ